MIDRLVAQPPAAEQCAACGNRLDGVFYIFERPGRFCANCMATRVRCDSCGAPVGDTNWRLHDGRVQCAHCHPTAVYDPAEARRLFDETVAAVVTQFDLRLRVGVEFRLVDAPALAAIRARGGMPELERTLGLYHREGLLRAIYLLYGLPRLVFRTTVAHEYAHAWQGEHCPLLRDPRLREGFAEWVAYRHLQYLGCTRAAERMLSAPHPYRPALEYVLALERQFGVRGLIDYLRLAE